MAPTARRVGKRRRSREIGKRRVRKKGKNSPILRKPKCQKIHTRIQTPFIKFIYFGREQKRTRTNLGRVDRDALLSERSTARDDSIRAP